ncbi:MAG: hypothetical protein A3K77_07605, partial [Euryarchaeota archaeon RBG_13_31_8]
GIPKTFIRLQGCKVGCTTCDSKYTWSKKGGKLMSEEDLVNSCIENGFINVTVTGGSPLEQHIIRLVKMLRANAFNVTLEESGQYYNEDVFDAVNLISLDIKTPSSSVKANMKIIEKTIANFAYKTQIKCVVANRKDFEFAAYHFERLQSKGLILHSFILTPCWLVNKHKPNTRLIKWMIKQIEERQLEMRIIIQQHKLIYGAKKKGV